MKLDTFIAKEANDARDNIAATGSPGCTPQRLAWLEREVAKHGLTPINNTTKTKKEKAMPTTKKAPAEKAEPRNASVAPKVDSALATRYDKMREDTEAQKATKAKVLLDLYAKHGRYSVVRKIMGKGPNWTERQLDRLTGSHPEGVVGRTRNGAVRTTPKAEKAPAAKKATRKSPARKTGTAKRVRKAPAAPETQAS
jgi:hypothetical protein